MVKTWTTSFGRSPNFDAPSSRRRPVAVMAEELRDWVSGTNQRLLLGPYSRDLEARAASPGSQKRALWEAHIIGGVNPKPYTLVSAHGLKKPSGPLPSDQLVHIFVGGEILTY